MNEQVSFTLRGRNQNAFSRGGQTSEAHPLITSSAVRYYAGAVVDCRPFIDFMLDAQANSLGYYLDVMTQIVS